MRRFVEFLQKRNRFEILSSAKFIRYPFAFLAAVIEVEHRRDRIDAQTVQMKFAQPIQRVGDQKISNLVSPVIENVSAPIRMLAFARIEMFIQSGTVEASERECVFRKVCRHPIHDYADPFLVKMIYQKTKIIRRAISR